MSLKVEWRHFSTGDVFDITDRINLTDAAFSVTENAEELTVGASTLTIDDPDGDFDIPGHSYIRVTETECPDEHVIWAGFVTIRHIKRATGFLTEAARIWVGNLDDVNTVQARRILSETNDADRPAETDVERMEWLSSEGFISNGFGFSTANPVDMDASNLVGMGVYDAVNDCMLQSGKNCFQQDISDGMGGYDNFTYYDFAASTALSSDLQISNYISDITAEVGAPSPSGAAQTWYASLDTDMERDPTRIYWKVRGQYDGGTVTRTRPATAVNFAARETTASWPLVKTAGAANARADRYLLDISTEEDVITTTIWVHPDHVNDARAGRRIQARFSHLPGYEDWTWMRILNRTVTFETPEVYRIQYTLSPGSPSNPAGTCTTIAAGINPDTFTTDGSPGSYNPTPMTPSTPTDFPSIVIGMLVAENGGTFLGGPEGLAGGSAYTLIENGGSGLHTNSLTAYEAASGAPGVLSMTWTGNSAINYLGIAIAFPTAATSPAQTGSELGSGSGTITLGSPPSPGNLLVLFRDSETSGWANSPSDDPVNHLSWTLLSTLSIGTAIFADCWIACVLEGTTDAIYVGNNSFAHWSYLSEWAL